MRDLLTILAALVIAVLTAAVAAPGFVDWTAHRDFVDRALSRAAGTSIATEGAIDVRLLPAPRLKLERVRVGGTAPDAAALHAAFLRTEIALTPLLAGEVKFRDTRIGRAEIRVPQTAGAGVQVPEALVADAVARRGWAIEDLAIGQLFVTTIDPGTGRTDQVLADNVAIQAQSLVGPWRVEGTRSGVPFQIATGELGMDRSATLKASAGGGARPRLELDGMLRLVPDGPAAARLDVAGTSKVTILSPGAGQGSGAAGPGAPGPNAGRLVATAKVKSQDAGLALEDVAIEGGEGAAALRLTGTGTYRPAAGRLDLALEGRRFDLDAARAAGGAAQTALVSVADFVRVDLSLRLETLIVAGEEWSGLDVQAGLAGGRVALRRFDVAAPGPIQVGATGEFGLSFAAGGTGRVTVRARAGDRLAAMLDRLGLGPALTGFLDGRPVEFAADLVVAEPIVSLRNLQVAFADATLSGALRYTAPDGGARGRIDAQLALQGLDLLRAPPPTGLFGAARDLDLGLILDARNVAYGAARGTGRIAARIASDGPALRVERLEIADLGGASGSLSGRIEPDGTGRIEGRVSARRAAPLLDLAGSAWLGPLARLVPPALRDRDLDLAITAERAAAPDGTTPGLKTNVRGRVAGGPFEAETLSAGGRLVRLDLRASADRLRTWSGGADLPALARSAQLSLTAAARPGERFDLTLSGDLGGVRVRTTTPLALEPGDVAVGAGALEIAGDDLSPLAALVGEARLATTLTAGRLALTFGRLDDAMRVGVAGRLADTDVAGDLTARGGHAIGGTLRLGRVSLPWLASVFALDLPAAGPANAVWPTARFGPPPVGSLQGSVSVEAAAIDLGGGLQASAGTFDLAVSPDGFALRRLAFGLAGGRVEGEITLARQGGLASLNGGLKGRDLALATLSPTSGLEGRVSAELRFGAAAESVAGLVANLGGAGTIALADLVVPKADPAGLARMVPRVLRSDDALAPARVRALAGEELDRAPLRIPRLAGSATLISGALRAAPLRGEAEGAVWSGALGFDLRNLTLDVRGTLQSRIVPAGWSSGDPPQIGLGLGGPLARPVRTFDVGPLVSGLAAAVLTRELDRIDTFEADQNERQRRTSRREMDRARQSAEDSARLTAKMREIEEQRTLELRPPEPRPTPPRAPAPSDAGAARPDDANPGG